MLYREIIAVCSEIHTKHINTLCGQNVELLNVKSGGTYNYHWALKFNTDFNVLQFTSQTVHQYMMFEVRTVVEMNTVTVCNAASQYGRWERVFYRLKERGGTFLRKIGKIFHITRRLCLHYHNITNYAVFSHSVIQSNIMLARLVQKAGEEHKK